jgi:hypothetical protein
VVNLRTDLEPSPKKLTTLKTFLSGSGQTSHFQSNLTIFDFASPHPVRFSPKPGGYDPCLHEVVASLISDGVAFPDGEASTDCAGNHPFPLNRRDPIGSSVWLDNKQVVGFIERDTDQ